MALAATLSWALLVDALWLELLGGEAPSTRQGEFHRGSVTLVKCNFRAHYNVGSSTILIEWLMFRNNPRITVTFPSNLL